MKKLIAWGLFALVSVTSNAATTAPFKVCNSTYALCTTAICKPAPGREGYVACDCVVQHGYSAGSKDCTGVIKTAKGEMITSRYYPVQAYIRCSNNQPWAFCLDSPCLVDPKDPNKATCICNQVKNKGDYVIVANESFANACTSSMYSSATVDDINQITEFLKGNPNLPAPTMKVLKP